MRRFFKNLWVAVGAMLLGIFLVGCGGGAEPEAGTPEATAVSVVEATDTSLPSATETAVPTQVPTPEVEMIEVDLGGVSFTIDGRLVEGIYPRQGDSKFRMFMFGEEGFCGNVGCIRVDDIVAFEAANPDTPLPLMRRGIVFEAQKQPVAMQNGSGTRSLLMRGQDGFFANNRALAYEYHGLTADGRYFVHVIIPVDAPILLSHNDPSENTNVEAIPVPEDLPADGEELRQIMFDYNRMVEDELNKLEPSDFEPDLALLDEFVASIEVDELVIDEIDQESRGGETAVCPAIVQTDHLPITIDETAYSIADMVEPSIIDFLNAGGTPELMVKQAQYLTLDSGDGTVWQGKMDDPIMADLFGNGRDDLILNLNFYEPFQFFNGALFIFFCLDGAYVGGGIATLAGAVVGEELDNVLVTAMDMNGNGIAEIVFSYPVVVGTNGNFTRDVRIMEWDGSVFVDLIETDSGRPHAPMSNAPSSNVAVVDRDGDGIYELELQNGVARGMDADEAELPMIDVWVWNGEAFVYSESREITEP